MPRIGSFGSPIRICNSSSRKQTRFRGNQIHLPSCHLDLLTVYSSCKLKTRQDNKQGIKLPLEALLFIQIHLWRKKKTLNKKWSRIGPLTVLATHHKHLKYLRREFNHGHCLSHIFLLATALKKVAKAFNSVFVNIAQNYIDEGLQGTPGLQKLRSFVSEIKPSGERFNITSLTSCFVKKQINLMSTTKATGLDKVPVRLLKLCVNEVADSLTSIINLNFETATFPDIWKIPRVTPIFKSRDKSVQRNYRPISVLPVISKICERNVHVTFLSWLQKFRLLMENQSAYLKNHSCVTALIDITATLLLNMDRGDIRLSTLLITIFFPRN